MMHTDKKNLGPSAIIGLGDYQDGKLWGCASPTARRPLRARPLRSRPSAPAVNLRANPLPVASDGSGCLVWCAGRNSARLTSRGSGSSSTATARTAPSPSQVTSTTAC